MKTSLSCILAVLLPSALLAADLPGSYIEQLDSASRVLVGRITAIQPVTDQAILARFDSISQVGRATFDITQTLLGDDYTTEFIVRLPDKPGSLRQNIIRTHRVGESGIWIIGHDGFVIEPNGRIDEQNRDEVLRSIHALQTRKWSEPVNGLRAWAIVVNPADEFGYFTSAELAPNPVMLFAVQNISTNDLYLPTANEPGFIRATATAENGHIFAANLNTNASWANGLFTRKLAPQDILYFQAVFRMAPDSWFDLAAALKLPPGKYSVVISCLNSISTGRAGVMSQEVAAWTGELKAPPVELEILPDAERRRQAEARQAAYHATHPQIIVGPAGPIVTNPTDSDVQQLIQGMFPAGVSATNTTHSNLNPLLLRTP